MERRKFNGNTRNSKELIGSIEPRGDSQIDEKRYENLIEHAYLVSDLVESLIFVSRYKDSYEASVKKLGVRAYNELLEIRDCINSQIED